MSFNKEVFEQIINDTTYLLDCITCEDFSDFDEDELREAIEDYINSEDIIYYSNAIEYLSKNDCSLRESLELANELGCTVENLNSELLATLHYQNVLSEELANLDLSECFEGV